MIQISTSCSATRFYLAGQTDREWHLLLILLTVCSSCCLTVTQRHLWSIKLDDSFFNKSFHQRLAYCLTNQYRSHKKWYNQKWITQQNNVNEHEWNTTQEQQGCLLLTILNCGSRFLAESIIVDLGNAKQDSINDIRTKSSIGSKMFWTPKRPVISDRENALAENLGWDFHRSRLSLYLHTHSFFVLIFHSAMMRNVTKITAD